MSKPWESPGFSRGGAVKFGSVCSGIEAASVAEKTCTKCGASKPLTDYHRSSKSNDRKAFVAIQPMGALAV